MIKAKQLVEVVEQRSALQDALKEKKLEFENAIAVQKAQLEDLMEKEEAIRANILDEMVASGDDSIEIDDKQIILSERMTPQIVDANLLYKEAKLHLNDFLEGGIENIEEMIDGAMETGVIITDKKAALKINELFVSLTGSSLSGMDIKKTKYLTLKNKTN